MESAAVSSAFLSLSDPVMSKVMALEGLTFTAVSGNITLSFKLV